VEFVSRSRRDVRRDYIQKRTEYVQAGVREYWVIDRFRRKMSVFRADGSTLELAEAETYRPPLMPGFDLPLPKLFAAADRFSR
jgi:Uma2 family endonuclease